MFKKSTQGICHQVLEYLYNDSRQSDEVRSVGSIKLAEATNVPIAKIHDIQHILSGNEEIGLSIIDGQSIMVIQPKGRTAFVDQTYKKLFWRQYWDSKFAWARIVIPLTALIVAIATIIVNLDLRGKVNRLEDRIEVIEKKIK